MAPVTPHLDVTMKIQATWLFNELAKPDWDVAVFEGSSRSSKTFTIIQWLVGQCLGTPGLVVRAFRNDSTTCRKTIMKDFHEVMRDHYGLYEGERMNRQEKIYRYANGSEFHFDGTMDVTKLHGLRQDIAWLNEVMEIKKDAFDQIEPRTTQRVVMDFNPSITNHWVFESVLTRDAGVLYAHSTYLDNPFLQARQVAAIERWEPTAENVRQGTANEWKWRVYGLGERAGREGRIFTNYRQGDFWPERQLCERWGYGLDFGYVDPTALIECALFQNELHVRAVAYESGLAVSAATSRPAADCLEGRMEAEQVDRNALIVADSAKPEHIAALAAAGYNMVGAKKGPDSIAAGIDLLQGYTLVVHRQSPTIIEELENYVWDTHRVSGNRIDGKPIDEYNHALDAIRYWAMQELGHWDRRSEGAQGWPSKYGGGNAVMG